ncbi:GNAT family N-acetyltransferase [Alkalibacillus haloalkaliphilus]|uniref:Alanine acetyltransferase n=1 Tax=Alkalibacillus haloalkaliphilus TaxID=94136 RepID=A0A511W6S8_9BACI|nr:GNAT family N-acetyltransferase [Alkalibacillus haloalkaliphilus]GEN46805.1 alanine acetyltransferase [Alkalibacillus haloalkaliphilus]
MLKRRELQDVPALFPLLSDEAVKPFVREKADTMEAYYFFTNMMNQQEENGELISRTILDEMENPVGAITLYDIDEQKGFLATWLGKPYFGQGYNQYAKELFLWELFMEQDIEVVFLKVNKLNNRSLRAVNKLSYAVEANETYPNVYEQINQGDKEYDLFAIYKDAFIFYMHESDDEEVDELEA